MFDQSCGSGRGHPGKKIAIFSFCFLFPLAAAHAAQLPTDTGKLGEIVVTAERVAAPESKTPVSMEVITQTDLVRNGVVDLQSLTQQDSSLNFDAGNGSGWITLRGLAGSGSNAATAPLPPAVPVAFDGFYSNLTYIFNAALYDVSRIEVLRGPQGTLFGRNTTGGLVNVITKDPGPSFGGYGVITLANYHETDFQGAVNLPFSPAVQMRIAYASARHAGYRRLAYGMGEVADDEDTRSGRVKLAFEPVEGLKAVASLQVTHVGGAGVADNIFTLPADPNGFPTHVAIPLTSYDASVYNVAFPSQVNIDDKLMQLNVTYDRLPYGMTLSYLGGYDALDYLHVTPTVGLDAAAYQVPTTIELLSTQDPRTQNEEVRLTSAQDQKLTWQAGFYYFRQHMANNDFHFRDAEAFGAPDFFTELYGTEQESSAGYGQLDWHLGSTVFSAGARFTHDYGAQTDQQSPADGITPATLSDQYSKWTWHIGEQWNVTSHNFLYAKVDTGYQAGYFNQQFSCPGCTNLPVQPVVAVPYAPEYVTAYEIGSKNRQFSDHLMANVDAFYMVYKDKQMPQSSVGGIITVNASRPTDIYGAEGDLRANIEPLGRINLNATWLHARFDSQLFTNALGQVYNIGGNRLPQAPALSLTAAFEHGFPIGSGALLIRLQTKYQSGQFFDFYNFPDSYQPSYTRTDAHLIYEGGTATHSWSIDAFVRNVENARVIADESESFSPPLSMPGVYNVDFQSPRTYGISISTSF